MNAGLPSEWRIRELEQISYITSGGTPLRSRLSYYDGDIPWAKIRDLTKAGMYIEQTEEKITEAGIQNSNAKVFPKETILVTLYGSIGKVAICKIPMATNQAMVGIMSYDKFVDSKYLYFFLLSKQSHLDSLGRGATQRNINAGHVRSLPVPLPPFEEQKRIVEILEMADELRCKRMESKWLIDKIIMATFIDMFGKFEEWATHKFGSLIESTRNGLYKPLKFYGEGIPILRMYNIKGTRIDISTVHRIRITRKEFETYQLREGDVLFNRVNTKELVGKCAVIVSSIGDCVFESKNIRIRLDRTKVEPLYVVYYLSSKKGRNEIEKYIRGAIHQSTLNNKDLRLFNIRLPPLKLQRKFSQIISLLEEKRKQMTKATEELEKLFQNLLNKAFTGELTQEWRIAKKIVRKLPELSERQKILIAVIHYQRNLHKKSISVTIAMKDMFLLQEEKRMDLNYNFIPYKYGPFSKEVYVDLEKLESELLILRTKTRKKSEKQEIIIDKESKENVEEIVNSLPEESMEAIKSLVEEYGSMDLEELLDYIYSKYPTYAVNSKRSRRTKSFPNF